MYQEKKNLEIYTRNESYETEEGLWEYSLRNKKLIMAQMPEATKVAGLQKWQSLGRTVKKGSKAIKIFAPTFKTVVTKNPQTGEEIEKQIRNFIPVNVFDITQTSQSLYSGRTTGFSVAKVGGDSQ